MTKAKEVYDQIVEGKDDKYSFLFTDNGSEFSRSVALLVLGGSHAYGTSVESSDTDIRGIYLPSKEDIVDKLIFSHKRDNGVISIEGEDFVLYSLLKIFDLFVQNNPNTLEILGVRNQDIIYCSPIGRSIMMNRKIFLSKRCIYTFKGYAADQFRRLDNKAGRLGDEVLLEKHLQSSIARSLQNFFNYEKHSDPETYEYDLYIDKADNPEMEKELFVDLKLSHYPVRDYNDFWKDISSVMRSYKSLGKRNRSAINRGKLGKHMMHCLRLYMMCYDILTTGEIITYREKEHDLLMDIRNNTFIDQDDQPTKEFFEIAKEWEEKVDKAALTTLLPEEPDYDKIRRFTMDILHTILD